MKIIYLTALIFIFSQGLLFAQAEREVKAEVKEKKTKKKDKNIHDLQLDGEIRKTSEYREQLVEGGTKKYEKKFRKRKIPKGTVMGDCPGDPKSKFNKKNKYKHKGRA